MKKRFDGNSVFKAIQVLFGDLFDDFVGIKQDSTFTEAGENEGFYNFMWFINNAESPQFFSFLFFNDIALNYWAKVFTVM